MWQIFCQLVVKENLKVIRIWWCILNSYWASLFQNRHCNSSATPRTIIWRREFYKLQETAYLMCYTKRHKQHYYKSFFCYFTLMVLGLGHTLNMHMYVPALTNEVPTHACDVRHRKCSRVFYFQIQIRWCDTYTRCHMKMHTGTIQCSVQL